MGKIKHGIEKDPAYQCWMSMRSRCNNPNHKSYHKYGGRGIKVCYEWDKVNGGGFRQFLKDMGPRPSKDYSIDRIDNDGDYEPNNCRWATRQEQSINRGMMGNNTSGIKGVRYCKSKGIWKANYFSGVNKHRDKNFTVKKYGDTGAFFLAVLYRKLWEICL